jgi:membrane associated rhomboid family serine protease
MYGYRPLTKSEKAEQKFVNEAAYLWLVIGIIIGIVVFFTISHIGGIVTGAIIAFFCLNSIDHSDMTKTDSGPGTCEE